MFLNIVHTETDTPIALLLQVYDVVGYFEQICNFDDFTKGCMVGYIGVLTIKYSIPRGVTQNNYVRRYDTIN